MRFLYLRVADYRGINEVEVRFGPTGITLIQGPNEAGKSSLGEAIGLLFEYPDSSRHHCIDAIRPVHRDAGPEIELTAESGPYAFTYFKRFHKKPETRLTVTRPKAENHTGREAHDRAEAILRETIDIGLWKALTIYQGEGIDQPAIADQSSLSSALDKAAGGHPADPRQEDLFNKVRDEYLRYFTERGSERKELTESGRKLADARAEVERHEQAVSDLEKDIDRTATLQRELGQLNKQESELAKALAGHAAALEEIVALENAVSSARLKLESARKSEQVARQDRDMRRGLIEAVEKVARAHKAVEASSVGSLSALNRAKNDLEKARQAFNDADRGRKDAETLVSLRRADFDYYGNKLHLEQLQERKQRIDEARQSTAGAEEALAGNRADDRRVRAIQAAERELLTADARLQVGAPSVLLRGRAECRITVDGAEVKLARGEERRLSAAGGASVIVPGLLDIEITAGSSVEDLSGIVEKARGNLAELCAGAGVSTPEEARTALEKRREAARDIEAGKRVEKDNLRDLSYEELDRKLLGLRQCLPDYPARRANRVAIAPGLDSAKNEVTKAEARQKETLGAWETARDSLDTARNARDGFNEKHQEARIQLDLLSGERAHARENLERARMNVSDDKLEAALANAAKSASLEAAVTGETDNRLKAKNPERVKTLAETTRGSLQTAQARRNTAQTELVEVQARLKVRGEEGLHEKLQAARTCLEREKRENRSLLRRAAAAEGLFRAMNDQRDQARKAYVAPLKAKIEQLGRLVFDDSFQVEVSEDLRIVRRTAGNITVPYEYLSGGTREQLSLIFRLACSMIVAEEGGAPLVLDDALGYTDPERLALMGAVLARAASACQIVILTCLPERYANIGKATVVSLK